MAATAWPTVATPLHCRVWLDTVAIGEESPFTGAREVMLRWQVWRLEMRWIDQPYLDNLQLEAAFSRSDGGGIIFQVPIFRYPRMRGSKTGGVSLSGAHAAGATSLTITGGSGTLLQGDWVQILQATDVPRAYRVTSSESGGVIGIRPGLRVAHSSGAVVHHLASVPDGWIKDTMQLDTPDIGALVDVGNNQTAGPLALEWSSALRLNP